MNTLEFHGTVGKRGNGPFRAIIFCLGCMMADSAVMGRLITLLASARSMMTTCPCSPTCSRTQMKWSDSSVKFWKETVASRKVSTYRYSEAPERMFCTQGSEIRAAADLKTDRRWLNSESG